MLNPCSAVNVSAESSLSIIPNTLTSSLSLIDPQTALDREDTVSAEVHATRTLTEGQHLYVEYI